MEMFGTNQVSLLYSGGLDSFIAYHYAKSLGLTVVPIYVNLGHPYSFKEKHAMAHLGIDYTEIPCDLYSSISSKLSNQIIPSRNLLLATIGAMFSERVWICALDGEQNGKEHDKSKKFFDDATELLTFTNKFFRVKTVIETPFSKMSKSEIITWALNYGIPDKELLKTSSCYHPTKLKCGECLTCYKRAQAFYLNDIIEECESDPFISDYAKEIDVEMKKAIQYNDYSRFNSKRIAEYNKFINKRNNE